MQMKTQVKTQVAPSQYALSEYTDYKPADVELIKQTVAKNTTGLELKYFLNIAKSVNLNPIVKEIWCYKDNRGNLITFAGRDGFRSIAQRNKNFDSINSLEVCEKDIFEMGADEDGEMKIKHKFGVANRGRVIGAYAVVKLKNGSKVIEYADLTTYDKGQFTWKTHTAEMIKKVAEVHALKKVCNIRGIYAEEEFVIQNGKVQTQIIEASNGNAEALKPKALPKMATKEQIKEIKKLLPKKGRTEANVLDHYKKEKLNDFTGEEAQNIITILENAPDIENSNAKSKAVEGEVVEPKQKPKKDKVNDEVREGGLGQKGKLSKEWEKIQKQKKEEIEPVKIDGETCEIVNELSAHDPRDLTEEQKQLIADCNNGKFQGKSAYPSIFNQAKK